MFPGGWPGRGLLLLRLTDSFLVLYAGVMCWFTHPQSGTGALMALSSVLGILVLLGLWTPIACVLLATSEALWLIKQADDPRTLACLITINLAIAMLGPGVLSIDAARFGRQRIDLPDR
jgi:uncharacterized membrane protein YphA (DoxX/SURF4 family)